MRERDVEKHFINWVEKLKGEVRKVKWISRAHAPDRLALLPGQHFYAELKAPGKEARAGQAREHVRMRKAGCRVYVLDTVEKIDLFFNHLSEGV